LKVSFFGLGYVGCVGMGCLAKSGHTVIGVDTKSEKVDQINRGEATIVEADISDLIKNGVSDGFISATLDCDEAILNSDLSFIAVGTPNGPHGHLNLEYVFKVAKDIGKSLQKKNGFHVIIIRSTVLPGTNKQVADIVSAESGKNYGIDFAIVSNPEFLREGTAVKDFFNPELTVIGTDSEKAFDMMSKLYNEVDSKIYRVPIRVGEMIKYVNNSYHALKIAFANEVGNICKEMGVDSHALMNLFCEDTKLNISPVYFRPGFAYGGSCLPKDLKALTTLAHDNYIDVPVLSNIERSNSIQKEYVLEKIMEFSKKNIGILGLSFKKGTDDLRNSPAVEIVERLLGKGYWIHIYDKYIHLAKLTGTNKQEIENKIPKIGNYISDDLTDVVEKSEVIVITYNEPEFKGLISRYPDKKFIDLSRIDKDKTTEGNYCGFSW